MRIKMPANLKELSSFVGSSQTGIQQQLVGLTTDRGSLCVCVCACVCVSGGGEVKEVS